MIYHLFPLGACGAPWTNPGGDPVPRIRSLVDWIAPVKALGADTLLLGPIWESGTHGYDTHHYTTLDRRLGTNDDLAAVLGAWKAAGIKLVFDGVFHHVGRGFGPFADLAARGADSPYRDWFHGVDFGGRSPYGDPFTYHGWNGHLSLVKLNLAHPEVRAHLFAAVDTWIEHYDLDGLRLDAADVIDKDFLRALAAHCRRRKPGFWLMGEVIHGDYRDWAPGADLDAVTNYELYKGLWSSLKDGNYHELAWSLNRQFGPEGLYRGLTFSTFGDNHDVNRLASTLPDPALLYPHAIASATVPGIPTVYYGSEAGATGTNDRGDEALRPALGADDLDRLPHQPLRQVWSHLNALRKRHPALRHGDYRPAHVAARQMAYFRTHGAEAPVLVALNSASESTPVTIEVPAGFGSAWTDVLNPGQTFSPENGRLTLPLEPCWGRILTPI